MGAKAAYKEYLKFYQKYFFKLVFFLSVFRGHET